MQIKDLIKIISHLPEDTTILIEHNDIYDLNTIDVQIHSDGRIHLILSSLE